MACKSKIATENKIKVSLYLRNEIHYYNLINVTYVFENVLEYLHVCIPQRIQMRSLSSNVHGITHIKAFIWPQNCRKNMEKALYAVIHISFYKYQINLVTKRKEGRLTTTYTLSFMYLSLINKKLTKRNNMTYCSTVIQVNSRQCVTWELNLRSANITRQM